MKGMVKGNMAKGLKKLYADPRNAPLRMRRSSYRRCRSKISKRCFIVLSPTRCGQSYGIISKEVWVTGISVVLARP